MKRHCISNKEPSFRNFQGIFISILAGYESTPGWKGKNENYDVIIYCDYDVTPKKSHIIWRGNVCMYVYLCPKLKVTML